MIRKLFLAAASVLALAGAPTFAQANDTTNAGLSGVQSLVGLGLLSLGTSGGFAIAGSLDALSISQASVGGVASGAGLNISVATSEANGLATSQLANVNSSIAPVPTVTTESTATGFGATFGNGNTGFAGFGAGTLTGGFGEVGGALVGSSFFSPLP